MNTFSIIIPTFNESGNIINLLEEILQNFQDEVFEIIVVDDNSPDGTAEQVKKFAALNQNSKINCINRHWKKGLSSAVVEGMSLANSQLLLIMDGDGQHDPKDIRKMLILQKENNLDLVIGSRFLEYRNPNSLSDQRSFISKYGIRLTQYFIGDDLTDPLTGFFLIRKSAVEPIIKKIYKDGFKILFDILMLNKKMNYQEISINFRKRIFGKSKLNISTLAHLIGQIIENLSKQLLPSTLFVFSIIGSIGVAIHLSLLYMLLNLEINYISANACGSILALTSNYFLNNFLTFNNIHDTFRKKIIGLIKYSLTNSLSLLTNIGIASVLYFDNFSIAISTLLGITAGLLLNYFLSRNIVFKL